MKAAILDTFDKPLIFGEVSLDEPLADEVVIRVAASGVCHSDLNIAVGNIPVVPLPQILGHEVAGIIERVGSGVSEFAVGDRVVTCSSGFCGGCEWCMRGLIHLCTNKRRQRPAGSPPRLSRDGSTMNQFAGLGGFAEQMLVHERTVAKIPDAMPFAQASLLGCAVVTGMGSVLNTAQVRPGQTVAVIGCGGVGLNAVQAARFSGAARIIALDRMDDKLKRAVEFGATDIVNVTDIDPVAAVKELTGGGVDHAFEVVGRPQTIEQAFGMLKIRGTATVVGVARPADKVSISALDLLSEKRLQGAQMGSSRYRLDIALFAQMYLDGRIKLDELISRRIGLDDVNSALFDMDDSSGARSVITFDL